MQKIWQRAIRGCALVAVLAAAGFGAMRGMGPARAASAAGGLSVFVGYAEDKETNTPNPATFPVPWAGAPNTIFLGGPVVGQIACHQLLTCYDAGALRLDNPGSSAVVVSKVTVDMHANLAGGKVFSLWGSFTVPAGQSVILTENPPGNNPNYDNFDTSGFPANNCTPLTVAPTVTLTIGGIPTTLVDSRHVLDTGGIDAGYCKPQQNESYQWQPIGALGSKAGSLSLVLGPAKTVLPVGQSTTQTATLLDGGGVPISNIPITFQVVSGPNAGQTGRGTTNQAGQAAFTYADSAAGLDIVAASLTTVGTWNSNQTAVQWGPVAPPIWTGADIGSPPIAGSQALSNGVWTVTGSGRDIGGTADQFHFVSQPLLGDGGIAARVVTQTNTNSRARAGVMLRASSDPSAPFYAVLVTPQRGIFVLMRASQGGGVSTIANVAGTVPLYLRAQRTGTTFSAATSPDGLIWTPIAGATVVLNLTGTLLAGMAVTSHSLTALGTATFDWVSVG